MVFVEFVYRCLTCQQVKADHRKSEGLQPLPIPKWKWEHIIMEFVSRFLRTQRGNDVKWVIVEIVDRLSKLAHFLAVRANITKEQLTKKYVNEIVRFHGIIASIMLNRNSRSKSQFLKSLQQAMGNQLSFSNGYHPQTNSKTERTNQTIEDEQSLCIGCQA